MKIEIRLRIEGGDGGACDEEILALDKPHDQLEMIGLSLAEARELLTRVQEHVVGAQAAAFVADHRHCDACGRRLWSKGQARMFAIQDGIVGEARVVERAFGIGPGALTEVMTLLQDRLDMAEA